MSDAISQTQTQAAWLDKPMSTVVRLDWEKALYVLIFVLAVLSRFWDLGVRAISHDESLHAVYAWNLYKGIGFQHSPLMHGPLRFHVNALFFGLFGADDFTVRIPPAIFGVALVMSPILLRRWLGRRGALVTSFLLLISPSILYHARYIRDEPFMLLYGVLLLWAVLSYLRERAAKWLYLIASLMALLYTTMEAAFIYVAIFGGFAVAAGVVEVAREAGWGRAGVGGTLLGIGAAIAIMLAGMLLGVPFLEALRPALPPDGGPFDLGQLLPSLAFIVVVGLLIGVCVSFVLRSLIPDAARRSAGFNLAIVLGGLSLFMLSASALLLLNYQFGVEYQQIDGISQQVFVLTDSGSGARISSLTDAHLRALIDRTEEAPWEGRDYSINAAQLALKEQSGADPALVTVLRQALGDRESMAVHVERSGNTVWGLVGGERNALYFDPAVFSSGSFPMDAANTFNLMRLLFLFVCFAALAMGIGWWWDSYKWLIALGIFGGIGVVLFTTVFTNGSGLGTGFVGSLLYWLAQQEVQRGSQPSGYYFFVTSFYEYLPMILTLVALGYLGLRLLVGRSTAREDDEKDRSAPLATPLLMTWTVLAWLIFTLAGEKMPWLMTHLALPMIVLGGRLAGEFLDRIDWRGALARREWLALILAPLLFGAVLSVIGAFGQIRAAGQGAAAPTLAQLNAAGSLLSGLLIGGGALAALAALARRSGVAAIVRMAALAAGVALSLMTIHTAWLYTYVNYDNVAEFGMYAHGGPGLKIALRQVEELSQRLTGTPNQIEVLYDEAWPFQWYLRDFPNKRFIAGAPTRADASLPVMILSDHNWSTVDQAVGNNYNYFQFHRIWWPMEDYKRIPEIVCPTQVSMSGGNVVRYANYDENADGSIDPIEQANGDARCRQRALDLLPALWDIFFRRDYTRYAELTGQTLTAQDWPLREDFRLYVRKDLAAQVWDQAVGSLSASGSVPVAVESDPYQSRWRETQSIKAFGTTGPENGQFISPHGLALAPDGSIYVADSGNHRVVKFDADGKFALAFGTWSGEPPGGNVLNPSWAPPGGTFYEPWDVAVGPDGSVYVADLWNSRVQKFDANGKFIKLWGGFDDSGQRAIGAEGRFYGPRGIAVSEDGRVFVADTGNKRVQVFDEDGNFLFQFGGGGLLDGNLDEPVGLAVTEDGEVIVADTWNGRLQVFSAEDGRALRKWDVDGWFDPAVPDQGQSKVGKPYLGVGPDGRIYVADQVGNRILVFSPAGEYQAAFGQFGADERSFSAPSGVAVDKEGNVLVVDTGNNRVMVFPPLDE